MQKIMTALLKAQTQISFAVKDKTNPHFKSKYATLESVIDAIKEPLNKNGIVIYHKTTIDGSLVTTLIHSESGEFIESVSPLIMNRQDMQQLGSAQSYAKRYNLTALTNLPTEDDDGNAASHNSQTQVKSEFKSNSKDVSNYVVKFGPDDIKNKTFKEIGASRLAEHCRSIVNEHDSKQKQPSEATQKFLDSARSYVIQCQKEKL